MLDSLVTVFFVVAAYRSAGAIRRKIDQLVSIVAETDQIPIRRNSPLKSRARISDGSERRSFVPHRQFCTIKSTHYHGLQQSNGSDGEGVVPNVNACPEAVY
jgi:hypothetical protein